MGYSVVFYPVGQGLFSEGYAPTIRRRGAVDSFRWIYDCGSVSDATLVTHAIRSRPIAPPPHLLAVSHFDRDHISGIVSLLQHTPVDTLLLPYLSLEQRVSAAIRTTLRPDHPIVAFCLDPVRFLASRSGARIRRVVFVPPGGEPIEERPPRQGDNNDDEFINMQTRRPDAAEAEVVTTTAPFSVSFLREGTGIVVGATFEMVPYNDGHLAKAASAAFQLDVRAKQAALLSGASGAGGASVALRAMRDRYDRAFGKSSFKRNVISLFLYASTIGAPRHPVRILAYPRVAPYQHVHFHCWCSRCCGRCRRCGRLGIGGVRATVKTGLLYTGDGFLNTAERYAGLEKRLGAQRMANLACVQVPHHGSRYNGYPGLAARLACQIGVFSSDPKNRLGHPHREVWADFAANGRCQVDRSHGIVVDVCT